MSIPPFFAPVPTSPSLSLGLQIGRKKGFNSLNTGSLEDTLLRKEEMGQDLPHKLFVEDMFIREESKGEKEKKKNGLTLVDVLMYIETA